MCASLVSQAEELCSHRPLYLFCGGCLFLLLALCFAFWEEFFWWGLRLLCVTGMFTSCHICCKYFPSCNICFFKQACIFWRVEIESCAQAVPRGDSLSLHVLFWGSFPSEAWLNIRFVFWSLLVVSSFASDFFICLEFMSMAGKRRAVIWCFIQGSDLQSPR